METDELTANRLRIKPQPQRQDSLKEQLADLHYLAARVGMYDAADWLWKTMKALPDERGLTDA